MSEIEIRPLWPSPEVAAELGGMTIEAVAGGALLGFLHPLTAGKAEAFWRGALAAAADGRCAVLGAWDGDLLIGTVTLLLDLGENKAHRGDIAKLITRSSHRGRGVASLLMASAEALAAANGRTLLSLGTAVEGGASDFYERQGYTLGGVVPDFLGKPQGGLTGQKFYWKRIG